jgi:hypothetical protein
MEREWGGERVLLLQFLEASQGLEDDGLVYMRKMVHSKHLEDIIS